MINFKDVDSSQLKIDKNSYKNIGIYYIGYLTFASTDKNKKVLQKYTKLWDEIKYHI